MQLQRVAASIEAGTGVRTSYERHATIHQLFEKRASETPLRMALNSREGALSYAQVEGRANKLAHYLREAGVGFETPVGVALERSLDVPVVLLAILKAGGTYVPLDIEQPAERTAYILEDAGVRVTIARGAACELLPESVRVINLDREAAAIAARPASKPALECAATDLAYIMYTSGSTGRPKGVACLHRGVVRLVRGTDFADLGPDEVFLQYAPLGFDASTFEIWAPLLNGGLLVLADPGPLSLAALGEAIEGSGITTLWLTASLFRLMVDSALPRFRRLRQLLTGGDVVSATHAARFLEAHPLCRLIDGYGPTENTTFSCCYTIPSLESIAHGVPIGRPIAHSTAYVLDEEQQPVEPGDTGELYVGGDGVARGYVNLPELTAERFLPDPFSPEPGARLYRTGDRVRLRDDGVIEFVGRNDLQVKIRGYRIELEEIEFALRAHPDVEDAALTAVESDDGKMLAAHVVVRSGASESATALRTHLAERLPAHMMPSDFRFVARLPVHPSGKLDRVALSRSAELPPKNQVAEPPARSERGHESAVARAVAEVWREVLGLHENVDLDENFFDAGGDSLKLLRLHAEIQRRLDARLNLLDFFEHTTLRALSTFLADTTG